MFVVNCAASIALGAAQVKPRLFRKNGQKGNGPSKSRGRGRRNDAALTAGSVSPDRWEILGRFDHALSGDRLPLIAGGEGIRRCRR